EGREGPGDNSQHQTIARCRMSNDLDLLDRPSVCRLFGGTRPIDPATLYRGIASGKFPAPIKIGPGSSRWLRSECEAALKGIIAARAAIRSDDPQAACSLAKAEHEPT